MSPSWARCCGSCAFPAAGAGRARPGSFPAGPGGCSASPGAPQDGVPGFGSGRTPAVGATLLLIITANTVSHQMTPMLTVLALAAFAVTGTTRYRTLWLAAGLVFAAWFSYGATDFWMGHLNSLFNEVGQIGYSVNRGVGQRLNGEPHLQEHAVPADSRLRCLCRRGVHRLAHLPGRRAWLVSGLLCAAPFVLVTLQSYGGEMIIRVFLLASPTLAPFVAIALVKLSRKLRRLPTVLVTVVAIILTLGMGVLETTNRGLNAAFEASTPAEDALTQGLINKIPPNSSVMVFSHAPHSVGARRALDPDSRDRRLHRQLPVPGQPRAMYREPAARLRADHHQGIEMMDLQLGKPAEEMESDIAALGSSETTRCSSRPIRCGFCTSWMRRRWTCRQNSPVPKVRTTDGRRHAHLRRYLHRRRSRPAREREVGGDRGSVGRGAIARDRRGHRVVFTVFAAILTFQRLVELAW